MLEWARNGARQFDWIVAKRQNAGRGRMGRAWESPDGNLYASTLVRIRDGDPPTATLALVAAIAAHHTAKVLIWPRKAALWSGIQIKWPNDIIYQGRKLAGVLLEREDRAVVVGIGMNLFWSPENDQRPSTSIAEIGTKGLVSPEIALGYLSSYFREFTLRWRSSERGGLPWVRQAWLQCAHPLGTPLLVRTGAGPDLKGYFAGLTSDCALLLQTDDGQEINIHAGDVFLI